MKALHVIPSVAPRYGGPSRAIFEMCHALEERGVGPLIATTDADGASRLPVELGSRLRYEGVPTIFFPRQWSEAFKYSGPLARWLRANVERFDVVHIHAVFSHACLAAARASRWRNVPYVVRPLGTLDPWALRQKRLRKRLLWHVWARRMLRGATAIHYTTTEERRLAEEGLGLDHGVVIPLGVREELLTPQADRMCFRKRFPSLGKDPYILMLSRLHPKKGLELLLEAFLALVNQQEFQHWRLVVAGEGAAGYVTSLQRLVQEKDGAAHVLFAGWLDGAENISALQDAALLALPSHQENFGLSVVEAMACGVPVLVSPHVNLAEEIRAAGAGWVVPLDAAALLQALMDALRGEAERSTRGSAGRDLVRSRFTWPRVSAELAQLYRSVTTQPLRSRS